MAIKPNIVVCGDSFCTSTRDLRTHFSQVLEDRYGYSVTNLARSAMSTVGICFQIQEAIKLSPGVIIYAETGPARIDIPLNNKFTCFAGLKNFIYHVPIESATGHELVGDVEAPIFSQNISTFADLSDDSINKFLMQPLDPQVRMAVKMFVTYLYQEEMKKITESWMYAYWHHQIQSHGIRPLRFAKDTFADVAYKFALDNPRWPRTFHTDNETQEILAQRIHDILQD